MKRSIKYISSLACIAGLAILLAACGGRSVKTVTARASATTTPSATTTSTDSAGSASTANSTSAQAAPLAQETIKESCSPGATVRIAVLGLRVHGQLATLQLGFTPNDPNKSASDTIGLFDMSCQSVYGEYGVTLVDPVNLKRYVVVSDSNNYPLESNNVQAVSGQTATGNWTFAAPPPTVTSIDVQVGNWPTFTNVPVQR